MSNPISEYFFRPSAKAFVVQFVLSLEVDGSDQRALQIKAYLVPATSEVEAREIARGMQDSLADRYRNRSGDIVTIRCEGIHKVEELLHVEHDGAVELGNFVFSERTQIEHLIHGGERQDLPPLD